MLCLIYTRCILYVSYVSYFMRYLYFVFVELLCMYVYLLLIYMLFKCYVIIDRSVHSCKVNVL